MHHKNTFIFIKGRFGVGYEASHAKNITQKKVVSLPQHASFFLFFPS